MGVDTSPTYNKGIVGQGAAEDSSRRELTARSTTTRFSPRTMWEWNSLPGDIADPASLEEFWVCLVD